MSSIEAKNNTKESKSNNESSKITKFKEKASKHKKIIIIGFLIFLLASPFIHGVVTGGLKAFQTQKAPQGELIFYVMHENDIKDAKLKKWIDSNHKTKGIHVYNQNKSSDEKYILLATGEQPLQDINIIMESVVGYEDKILINGRVEPPKSDIVKEKSYPYELIRIETKNDPRAVRLGTMNLYDVFRGIKEPIEISLDNAIVREIKGDTIKISTFKNKDNQLMYTLTEDALKELKTQNIEVGELVSVNLNADLSKGYPKVENIRKTTRAIEKIKITDISEKNKTTTVSINKIPFIFGYKGKAQEKINMIDWQGETLVKIEKKGDMIYITDIIG